MERKIRQSTVTAQALSTPEAQALYEDLKQSGYGVMISKKEYAEIALCSLSAVDNYMKSGYGIPPFRKIGHQRNARVLFSLRDVAEYLTAQTIATA